MPRGLMHDAENVGEAPSLHVTAGLITKTWADLLLESISELALDQPDFRRSLPAGFADREFDREPARGHFDQLTKLIADEGEMDSAFDLLADNFLRGRRPNVAGVIASLPGASSAATATGGGASCRGTSPTTRQAGADRPRRRPRLQARGRRRARAWLCPARPFSAADLKCEDPDELVRILWAAGFLERVA